MKKFNYVCSYLLVITLSLFMITLGQNIVARTSGTYLYYFNDTRVVDRLYTEFTNSQMADEIASFMNSWRPKEFQIYENTGYDMQGIFGNADSDNMLTAKTVMDISFIICLVCLILTVSIYVYFLKNDFKLVLRKRLKATWIVSALLLACEGFVLLSDGGRRWLAPFVGLEPLKENSLLSIILGEDFIHMAGFFVIGYTLIAVLAISYLTYVLTKPPRIFY